MCAVQPQQALRGKSKAKHAVCYHSGRMSFIHISDDVMSASSVCVCSSLAEACNYVYTFVSSVPDYKHSSAMQLKTLTNSVTTVHCVQQRQEVIQRKEEAAKQAAWGEAGVIIEELKTALADAQQQLCKERTARDQLEEDMKQSFMRSVCAINLEVSFWPILEQSRDCLLPALRNVYLLRHKIQLDLVTFYVCVMHRLFLMCVIHVWV